MTDLEAVAREIAQLEKMEDDLYLDDVGGSRLGRPGGKKYLNWGRGRGASRNIRNLLSRGRGRSKIKVGRGTPLSNLDTSKADDNADVFGIRADDLNMLDNWDLEVVNVAECSSLEDLGLGEDNTKGAALARGSQGKKAQVKKGNVQKPFKMGKSIFPDEDPDLEEDKVVQDMFDIESKSLVGFGQTFDRNWTRGPRKSGFVRDESVEEEERSPWISAHRKDPRFVRQQSDPSESRFTPSRNDPRLALKQPDTSGSLEGPEIAYAPARKDPRLVPQQALASRKDDPRLVTRGEKQNLRSDPRLIVAKLQEAERREGFENRFGPARKDPRLAAQVMDLQRKEDSGRTVEKTSSSAQGAALAPPGVEDSFEGSESRQDSDKNSKNGEPGQKKRRGPRSPSSPPLSTHGDHHSMSPSSAGKRDSSIGRMWDRSPGRGRPHRDRSPSPLRRTLSPRRRMSRRDHGDGIPSRHRERSLEWRRDRRSSSRDRRESSMSPVRRPRRSSPWRRERSRLSREWSGSPRRERSLSPRHDRSLSDRRDHSLSPRGRRSPFSPPHRSSLSSSRDEPWRQSSPSRLPPQPHYPQIQQQQQQQQQQQSYDVMAAPPMQNIYNESNYSSTAPPAPSYGAPASSMTGPTAPGYHSNYQQYGYDNYYQQPPPPPYSGDYVPPAPQPPSWPEGGMVYPDMSQPPPVQIPPASGAVGATTSSSGTTGATTSTAQSGMDQKSEAAKKEAIKNELIQQKQTLAKQREEYFRKKALISRELELLREQEEELLEENSRENDRFLKENNKLQLEIQNKLKAINNVIDMLTGIIGDKGIIDEKRKGNVKDEAKGEKKKPKTPPETPPQSSSSSASGSPRHSSRKATDGIHVADMTDKDSASSGDEKQTAGSDGKLLYNYVYYDPEMHWCRVCNVFPRTAKEYLNHLHSAEHKEETLERKLVDMPWHKIQADPEVPHITGAPAKRTPIRGLQFFISATAWYCKLCDVWIGDLHCASLHLKSKRHSENYAQFTEQNPHWETDWLTGRERAYERCSEARHRVKEEQDTLPPGMEHSLSAPASDKQFVDIKAVPVKEEKMNQKTKKKSKEQRKKMKKNCITALDESKKKKRRKKKGKTKKVHNSLDSSSSSNSSSSSSSSSSNGESDAEDGDKSKSIRVAMRNKTAPAFVRAPRSRWDSPEKLSDKEQERRGEEHMEREDHEHKSKKSTQKIGGDDKLIREWMSSSKDVSDGEKQLLNSIKDRLKQKQEADREKEKEKKREERERGYPYDSKGYYDDRRDSKRPRRRSESPMSPSYKSKRSRGSDRSPDDKRDRSRFDRYERHETSHRSPEHFSKKSPSRRESTSSKTDAKFKEEPEKKSEIEKKIAGKVEAEEDDDEESAESKFEKQTAEAAAKLMKKGKKPAVMTIPKSKLPFIGRMPILKHFAKKKGKPGDKTDEEDKKQLPEDPLVQAQYSLEFTNVSGKVNIGPQEQRKSRFDEKPAGLIGPELPPMGPKLPPNLVEPTSLGKVEPATEAVNDANIVHEVQDMEIDEDTCNVPVIETSPLPENDVSNPSQSPKKPLSEIPLPKDFQDALNILFPGPEGAEKKDDGLAMGGMMSQSAVIQSGPKPASIPPNASQGQWPQGGPHAQMMPPTHPMQGYGPQGPSQMMGGGGPPMMGPMHGMHGPPQAPPNMQGHMQGPQGMYGPPGMPGPSAPYGMHGPPAPMMGPPHNVMPSHQQSEARPPPPPLPKESKAPKPPPPKKETTGRKSDTVGEMSADELAMMGIDVGDMAAQSF
ncbi:serine/arginine repetitive matrix protein 2-like isoform X2 [Periplaneta americana]|uniref:serine/arginine repetitive matrix protein 2-like isoform X2 n=1 Tax=Periplaneta americana TaxID=6978 RepID=UPI0037E90155